MGIRIPLPQDEEYQLTAQASLLADQRKNETRYRTHPWPFIAECITTLDQASGEERRFPHTPSEPDPSCACGGCTNYQHHIVNQWFSHPRFLMPKSRRIMGTWTLLACHYWLARFRPASAIAIASRKRGENESQGSAELVKRIHFMHQHLPISVRPVPIVKRFGWLHFPETNSDIIAIAQGADQTRQYTFTAILADEMAFWEEAEGTYTAAIPTIEGGGRFTALSSAHPGFFKTLVHDDAVSSLTA